ncbi:hypothetical protein BH09ACT7_BH09ACT7_35240 [soil metagenome]
MAGVVAGAGSAVATAVAHAEPTATDAKGSADSGPAKAGPSDNASTPARTGPRAHTKSIGGGHRPDAAAASGTDAPNKSAKPPRPTAIEKVLRTAGLPAAASEGRAKSQLRSVVFSLQPAPAATADEIAQPAVSAAPVLTSIVKTTTARVVVTTAGLLAPAPHTPLPIPLPLPPVPATPATTNGVNATSGSFTRSRTSSTADVTAQAVDPTKQHVLVIGVDGTNLSKILDDPTNENFFDLMNHGTTSASTIVGHTTLSNPSWTAILTGVWDTKSGVINNVFTPATYDSWPTVFNQLEGFDSDIETKAIADWDVITDIADAGSIPADEVVFIPQVVGDTNWSQTDAAVTDETVKSIQGGAGYEDVPNFMFSYLVQVDENGHMYGGDSPEYAAAVSRTDDNLGAILQAVKDREDATGEEWTVIVVTDHGHQPQKGLGHGFQSPRETSTFVIAEGAGFDAGQINNQYSIVDVTPTVVSLFGLEPTSDADGVPLSSLGQSQVDPVNLHQALEDAIAMYGWPDIGTNVALTLRTVFGAIPYYVDNFTTDITAQLQGIVDQDIPVVSTLAGVAEFGVRIVGGAIYTATDLVAQIVGRLTGAGVIPPSTSTFQRATLTGAGVLV